MKDLRKNTKLQYEGNILLATNIYVFIFKIFLSVIAIKYSNTVEVWNKIE